MKQITLTKKDIDAMVAIAKKHNVEKFFIAKDEGAYVGITGGEGKTFENHIRYFRGMNPKKDADCYENTRYAFGGDDFGEFFPVETLFKCAATPNFVKLVIKVSASSIKMDMFTKRVKPTAAEAAAAKAAADEAAARLRDLVVIATEKKVEEAPKEKTTIAAVAMKAIAEGKNNDEVLEAVKAVFPNAKTSKASVAWYRSKMKNS